MQQLGIPPSLVFLAFALPHLVCRDATNNYTLAHLAGSKLNSRFTSHSAYARGYLSGTHVPK